MIPRASLTEAADARQASRKRQTLAAEVRLLYSNSSTGVWVTLVAAPILGRLQWGVISHRVIVGWCVYMFLVLAARFALERCYWRVAPSSQEKSGWGAAFATGAGLAGAGWGAAGILLYPEAYLANQVILMFMLGGMMLGAAVLLAPRPQAFLAFMLPTGLAPAVRLVLQGDEPHHAMGLMATLFTLATLITTRRIHSIVASLLDLRFEHQATEATLSESEERFRSMADAAHVMIWVSAPDKRCTFFNKAWLEFAGRTFEQEAGSGWIEGVHPDDVDRRLATYSASVDTRRGFQMEYRLRRADGEYRWVLDDGVPRFEPGGVFAGYVGCCIDITEAKRTQELALASQKLESLGQLANGVAHDFNNLLGGVLASAELALAQRSEGSSLEEELLRIRTAAVRGGEIVRQLMIYGGEESTTFELVDLSFLVEEMLQLLKVSISKHAILQTDLRKDLPAVLAHPAQIRQVVMNLVTNAAEALGERDGVIRVNTARVSVTGGVNLPAGDYVRLEVSDTGSGMKPEVQARIFDPFFTTKSIGRGLGLAAAQGIVRRHGGAIHFVSSTHEGTRFEVLVPCTNPSVLALRDTAVSPAADQVVSVFATVLMVEDEDTLRLAVAKMLRRKGFTVIEAANGTTGVDLFRASAPEIDVVLLDLTLPGMSGGEVLSELRRIRPDVKIIITSAYSQERARTTLSGQQPWLYIRKPYQVNELMGLLQNVCLPNG